MDTHIVTSHTQVPSVGDADFIYTAICVLTVQARRVEHLYVDVVVDKSYSMQETLSTAKAAVKEMIVHMKDRSEDGSIHVRISGFAVDVVCYTDGYVPVSADSVDMLHRAVDTIDLKNGDGTNISLAMQATLSGLNAAIEATPGSQGYVVLLTDGKPNRGETLAFRIHDEVHSHAKGEINIGAIALGDNPERRFMEELTKGGKFFYAPFAKDLYSAYEEVEGGLRNVVRHCKIESAPFGLKYGSGAAGDTISLPIDLDHEQLMSLPRRDGKCVLTFTIEYNGDILNKELEIAIGDESISEIPGEILAHRELVEANRRIEAAIQSAGTEGAEAAIGRLVNVAEAVAVVAQHTPAVASRVASVRHAVDRATSQLRSLSAPQGGVRRVRPRTGHASFQNIYDPDDDPDDDPVDDPIYRSLNPVGVSAGMPAGMPADQASLDLIRGEASSQMSGY